MAYKDAFLDYFKRVPQFSSYWLLLALEKELNPVEPWKHPADFIDCMTLYELREAPTGPKLSDDDVTELLAGL